MKTAPSNLPSSSNPDSPPEAVPLLDVQRGNQPLREEILAAIRGVCDSGRFLYGPDVQQLEQSVAAICQTQHAVGCASGSDALLLALMALDIKPGDEVITPSFTFFATASCIWRLGARIVFADIEADTFNIDPAQIEAAITPATKAILVVHLFGQCAQMDAIQAIARRHGVAVIEDVAQAIGAEFQGQPAGSMGDIGCFSFYPTKNLGGFGDGGMLTTQRPSLADKLRQLSAHGMQIRYYHHTVGINSRLDSLQAAVLNVKITQLGRWCEQRRANAARYHQLFSQAGLADWVQLPYEVPDRFHVWNQFTVRVPHGLRDTLRGQLADQQIGTEIYYPLGLHQQECFRPLGYGPGSLPETERAAREVLSLPIFPELADVELQRVVQAIGEVVRHNRQAA